MKIVHYTTSQKLSKPRRLTETFELRCFVGAPSCGQDSPMQLLAHVYFGAALKTKFEKELWHRICLPKQQYYVSPGACDFLIHGDLDLVYSTRHDFLLKGASNPAGKQIGYPHINQAFGLLLCFPKMP